MNFREISDRIIKGALDKLLFIRGYIPVKAVILVFFLIIAVSAGIKIIPAFLDSDDNELPVKGNDLVEIDIDISDYLVPEEITSLEKFSWVPYRGVRKKWSREEVDEFWINPEETVRDAAEEKNRKYLDELFESVP